MNSEIHEAIYTELPKKFILKDGDEMFTIKTGWIKISSDLIGKKVYNSKRKCRRVSLSMVKYVTKQKPTECYHPCNNSILQ